MKASDYHSISLHRSWRAAANRALVLSLESGESFFSLIIRYCRHTGANVSDFVGGAAARDPNRLRDFPVGASAYEAWVSGRVPNRPALFYEHSAAAYYVGTCWKSERARLLETAMGVPLAALRHSAGTRSRHLRFCPRCAESEREKRGFSWWHRDHQLPLSLVCLEHLAMLVTVPIGAIAQMRQPHELIGTAPRCENRLVSRLNLRCASLDRDLANGGDWLALARHLGRREYLIDAIACSPTAAARYRKFALAGLPNSLAWLFEAIEQSNAIGCTARWLLGRLGVGADPVVAVLMVAVLCDPQAS